MDLGNVPPIPYFVLLSYFDLFYVTIRMVVSFLLIELNHVEVFTDLLYKKTQ